MKFPYSMLTDFVSTALSAVEVGALLTMAGFELEGIEDVEGEPVLYIKVVSNRGDGLSVFGLSREILAKDRKATPTKLYEDAVARYPMADLEDAEIRSLTSVEVQTTDCPRYACRVIKHGGKASSPEWLKKRLRQAGMRPISLLVDLTNYVMLENGQPLHAFDFDLLHGNRIVVRKARNGERLTTLDGKEHELSEDQMMICDGDRPVAAAGIMGGLETEVTDSTKTVLLESANFLNTSVRRTRKQLGLSTEASYRFERSVDPELVVAALNRFAALLLECDDSAVLAKGVIDEYPTKPDLKTIQVRVSRARTLLGMYVTIEEAESYLRGLGFEVSGAGEPFYVTSPTWRPDIVREEDLIEEIGRVHGFDKVPEVLPQGSTPQGGTFGDEARVDSLRECLERLGFVQIISHSLRDEHPLDDPSLARIGPRTPASPETSVLRNSLLPSLNDAARRNGSNDLHLFEMGRVFFDKDGPKEGRHLGVMSVGALYPRHRAGDVLPQADFFSLKGALEEALQSVDLSLSLGPATADQRFHPTRFATVQAGSHTVGVIGQIHPDVASELGLPATTVLAEIDVYGLLKADRIPHSLKPVSRNPAVRRDIAVLVDKSVPFSRLEGAVRAACGDVLERLWLFDVYEGTGVPEGSHSITLSIQLRKQGENFTDEEANQVREKAVEALARLGAKLRG